MTNWIRPLPRIPWSRLQVCRLLRGMGFLSRRLTPALLDLTMWSRNQT